MKIAVLRRKTRAVKIGKVTIGSAHPIAIQSMTKVRTSDTEKVIAQINRLQKAGCEIVRLAVKDEADARAIRRIRPCVRIPVVADIHFSWRLAVLAAESGADKVRLNPGNIYKKEEVAAVISALKSAGIPLRIGLNSGSVLGFGSRLSIPDRLVKSCLDYVRMVEKMRFRDIVISLKASTVRETVEAYRKVAGVLDYPLHLGVTATGLPMQGMIKSSVAIGALLLEGIGDTIRISLTDQPEEEVKVARAILESLDLGSFGPQVVSCPTCGRCEVDLMSLTRELESALAGGGFAASKPPVKLAVMGCVVNGPGEAREADIGVAFGRKDGLLFMNGKPVRKIPLKGATDRLLKEVKKLLLKKGR